MPSPIGHALGGVAAGLMAAPLLPTPRARMFQVAAFAALGAAPDLDLIVGRHRLESHSLGAAAIIGVAAALMRWPLAGTRVRIFLAVAAAWFSHALLDYLGADTSHPYGVMIWWPLSSAFHYAGLSVLLPISRRWWLPGTVTHNLQAAAREILIIGPLTLAALWRRRRKSAQVGRG
jgi:membrane-bound metal-dependent hydrolase YbcI (DUF457 family)